MAARATVRNMVFSVRSFSSSPYNQLKIHRPLLEPARYSSAIADRLSLRKSLEAYHLFDHLLRSTSSPGLDPGVCNSLLATLSADGHLKFSETVFSAMLSRNIGFTTVGFGVFVNWYCRTAALDQTLGQLDRVRPRMDEINGSVVAVLVVDGLCRASRVMDAWRVLEELRRRDCKPDFIAYQIVVETMRELGRAEDARQVLKQKRKLSVAPRTNDYKAFIYGLISEKRTLETKSLAEIIIKGNFPIEDDVLDALIGSVSGDYVDSAFEFFKYMIGKESLPSLSTISSLSSNLIRSNRTEKMWEVFHILSSKDYFSDVKGYNTIISILCEGGQVKEAYNVLKEMRHKGIPPDIYSYNCLMEACCKEDLVRPAKRLWDEMFTYGCHGNLQTYNTLIRKLSKSGELQEARHLFDHMLGKGILPDNVTYSSLIKGMCREGRSNEAYEIFEKTMNQDRLLAASTLRTLILSLCKEGNFSAALKIMRNLPSSDVENSGAHVILIKSLSEAGQIKMAIDHLKGIRDKEPSKLKAISVELMQSLSFSLNMDPVLKLLQEMHEIGVDIQNPWVNLSKEIQV